MPRVATRPTHNGELGHTPLVWWISICHVCLCDLPVVEHRVRSRATIFAGLCLPCSNLRCTPPTGKKAFSCWASASCVGLSGGQTMPHGPHHTEVLRWYNENVCSNYTDNNQELSNIMHQLRGENPHPLNLNEK
jgi:hypothetical protein